MVTDTYARQNRKEKQNSGRIRKEKRIFCQSKQHMKANTLTQNFVLKIDNKKSPANI